MSKLTPGPWYAHPLTLQVVDKKMWFDEDGARHGDTPTMVIDCNSLADTHLIAAAPELLAALEMMLEAVPEPPEANCSCHLCAPCGDCVEYSGEREAFEFAKDAIAKAKGGAA